MKIANYIESESSDQYIRYACANFLVKVFELLDVYQSFDNCQKYFDKQGNGSTIRYCIFGFCSSRDKIQKVILIK